MRIQYVTSRAGRIFDPSPLFAAYDRMEAANKAETRTPREATGRSGG